MKAIERLFGAINLVYTLGLVIFIFKYAASIIGVLGNSFGILILLMPIIIGSAFSFNHLIKKTKGLHLRNDTLIKFAFIGSYFIFQQDKKHERMIS